VTYRYGQYRDGPDPLAPPYDARLALDELGDAVLGGSDPASALRDLIRRGMRGQRGLDDVLRRVRERQQEVRRRGRLDGILEQARALLDTAVGQERAELFPDPSDDARMREAELDSLPSDTAQAIRGWPTTTGGRPPHGRRSSSSRTCSGARCWTASSAA
jgi:uncharacterized protein with von Willebrand factor type A (vWA) domain